jgi:Raf kinase inhibitor-like YbhB/YbcL family protein
MKQWLLFTIAMSFLAILAFTCTEDPEDVDEPFALSSPSFSANQPIPTECSCEGKPFGQGNSPELHWTAGPAGTKSYAIVFQDTTLLKDAPEYGNHWIIWNIPANIKTLPKNLSIEKLPPAMGGAEQLNAAPPQNNPYGYFGPCPSWNTACSGAPRSNDTYAFTIYAFDLSTITVPAKDTTDKTNLNYVRQINAFLAAKALGKAQLITTSNAAPSSFNFCPPAPAETLKINSTKFQNNNTLPAAYGCEGKKFGEGISPDLHWTGGPTTTKRYAIVFKDVSLLSIAPQYAYHWMIWNIPDSVKTLPENLTPEQFPPSMKGAQQYSAGPDGGYAYLGPCPNWQTYCTKGETPAVQDTYSFTIYAFAKDSIVLPAKDATISTNYVAQISKYFDSIAVAKAEIKTFSSAVPSSAPQLCQIPAIPTPGTVDSEYQYLTIVGGEILPANDTAVNKWYDSTHIPILMTYPGLKKSVRYKSAVDSVKPGYLGMFYYPTKADFDGLNTSAPFDSANKEMAAHWTNGEYKMVSAISYEKIQSWIKTDYTGDYAVAKIIGAEFTAGKDSAVNNWYNTTHIPLIMKYAGIKKAVRFKKLAGGLSTDSLPTYLTILYFPTKGALDSLKSSPEWTKVTANQTTETVDDDITFKKVMTINLISTHKK